MMEIEKMMMDAQKVALLRLVFHVKKQKMRLLQNVLRAYAEMDLSTRKKHVMMETALMMMDAQLIVEVQNPDTHVKIK